MFTKKRVVNMNKVILYKILLLFIVFFVVQAPAFYEIYSCKEYAQKLENDKAILKLSFFQREFLEGMDEFAKSTVMNPFINENGMWILAKSNRNIDLLSSSFKMESEVGENFSFIITNASHRVIFKSLNAYVGFGEWFDGNDSSFKKHGNIFISQSKHYSIWVDLFLILTISVVCTALCVIFYHAFQKHMSFLSGELLCLKDRILYKNLEYQKLISIVNERSFQDVCGTVNNFWCFLNQNKDKCMTDIYFLLRLVYLVINEKKLIEIEIEKIKNEQKYLEIDEIVIFSIILMTIDMLAVTMSKNKERIKVSLEKKEETWSIIFLSTGTFVDMSLRERILLTKYDFGMLCFWDINFYSAEDYHYLLRENGMNLITEKIENQEYRTKFVLKKFVEKDKEMNNVIRLKV